MCIGFIGMLNNPVQFFLFFITLRQAQCDIKTKKVFVLV